MYCHIHHCHYHHCNCVPKDSKEKGEALTQEELVAYIQEMKGELKDYTVDLKDQIFSYIDIGLNPVEIANTFASLKEQDTFILKTLTKKIDELNNSSNLSMFNLRTRVTDLEGQSAALIKDLYEKTLVVESVADLSTIKNPKNGLRVYVKSYHAGLGNGGGYFTYNSSKSSLNDAGLVINGWIREWDKTHVKPEWWGAVGDDDTDDTQALQRALNYASTAEWQGSFTAQATNSKGLPVVLSPRAYKTTDTLWIGYSGVLIGTHEIGSGIHSNNFSTIKTYFDDPKKAAISSANFDRSGNRLPYDLIMTPPDYDNGNYSATPNIRIDRINVLCAEGTRGFIGIRLQNSPGASMQANAVGYDYGFLSCNNWQAAFNCRSFHIICGMALLNANNTIRLDGYFNAIRSINEPIEGSTDLLAGMKEEQSQSEFKVRNLKVGVAGLFNSGVGSTALICEVNDVGVMMVHSPLDVQSLYVEANEVVDFLGLSTSIDVGHVVGSSGTSILHLNANCRASIRNSDRINYSGKFCRYFDKWNSSLSLPVEVGEYVAGATYKNTDNVLYVSSEGKDTNHGFSANFALRTIDAALGIINNQTTEFSQKLEKGLANKSWVIVIAKDGTYEINSRLDVSHDITFTKSSNVLQRPTLLFNSMVYVSSARLYFRDVDIDRKATPFYSDGNYENGVFWPIYGENAFGFERCTINIHGEDLFSPSQAGASINDITLNNVDLVGTSEARIIAPSYDNLGKHKITFICNTATTISENIKSRSDRGIDPSFTLEIIGYPTTETITTGTTEQRPTGVSLGFTYFDTSLGKPIYWKGSAWVDSTGTTV